jgi:hypothetical protein
MLGTPTRRCGRCSSRQPKSRPRCARGDRHVSGRLLLPHFELDRPDHQAIGYKNGAKGLRRLDEWLENGCGDAACLQRIVDRYQPDPSELEKALADTERIHDQEHQETVREIEERGRRQFRPFIWVVTEDGAHSFLAAMAERQEKVLWLADGFERLSGPEKLATVQRRIREHCRKTDGTLTGFGSILRYTYACTFDSSIVLDTNGKIIEPNGEWFLLPEVWMELH